MAHLKNKNFSIAKFMISFRAATNVNYVFGMNDLETFAAVQKPVDSKQSSAYGKLS